MLTKSFNQAKVLNFITSIGAAIVVIGALMKITHRENADTFLTIGLVTEAVIFVIYAFVPPNTESDEMKVLKEIMPKRTEAQEFSGTNVETSNTQIEIFNNNLKDVNSTLEKIKSIFK